MRKKRTWKRPAHGGGHLERKKQTTAEVMASKQYLIDAKERWEYLFSRNKWALIK